MNKPLCAYEQPLFVALVSDVIFFLLASKLSRVSHDEMESEA